MTDNSVITKARRVNLCKVTSGDISTIPKINRVAFGDRGVTENGEPIPPTETQTELNHEVARYPIDGVEYPIDTTARYTVTIPAEDLAGTKISEAGLIDENGTLCAIKTMYEKGKDSGVIFTFTFDDEF